MSPRRLGASALLQLLLVACSSGKIATGDDESSDSLSAATDVDPTDTQGTDETEGEATDTESESSDSEAPTTEVACHDGEDNDEDGRVDCEDGDCVDVCVEDCADGLDNDQDAMPDCFDDECFDQAHCRLRFTIHEGQRERLVETHKRWRLSYRDSLLVEELRLKSMKGTLVVPYTSTSMSCGFGFSGVRQLWKFYLNGAFSTGAHSAVRHNASLSESCPLTQPELLSMGWLPIAASAQGRIEGKLRVCDTYEPLHGLDYFVADKYLHGVATPTLVSSSTDSYVRGGGLTYTSGRTWRHSYSSALTTGDEVTRLSWYPDHRFIPGPAVGEGLCEDSLTRDEY